MVAPANKRFTGAGTITGSGNIMGNAVTQYSFNITGLGVFTGSTLDWFAGTPAYITSHMPVGQPITITISGLDNPGSQFNNMQLAVINTGSQLVPGGYTVAGTDLTFDQWQSNWALAGQPTEWYPGFFISWSA
jgi:hypothetical protein